MIKLDIYDRCQDCPYFKATTGMTTLNTPFEPTSTLVDVYCSNRSLCDHLMAYLIQAKEQETDKNP